MVRTLVPTEGDNSAVLLDTSTDLQSTVKAIQGRLRQLVSVLRKE